MDLKMQNSFAVVVWKAYKKFGRKNRDDYVLKDFNMTVAAGTIYALLGASGCGKTTALTCILGQRKLNKGEVRVFGYKTGSKECGVPGYRVGYMPQNISLYMEFTIGEMLGYFGRIYGMTQEEVTIRAGFLTKLLQLPPDNSTVLSLSGGQRRRVSLAVSLIHKPELLLLDEPTVGVDAILRQSIWTYLQKICSEENTTVILTTHYIEEAKKSHVVGFMRDGTILVEDSPQKLMEEQSSTKLEDIFMGLLKENQPEAATTDTTATCKVTNIDLVQKQPGVPSWTPTFWKRVRALLRKNVLRYRHNSGLPLIFTVSPTLLMLLFCLVLGGDSRHLPLGVVNHEWPGDPICQPYDECLFLNLSCRLLQQLDKDLVYLVPYENEKLATQAVEDGYIWGYLNFPSNYSDSLVGRRWDPINLDKGTFLNSIVTLRMDMTNQHIGMEIQRMLVHGFRDFITDLAQGCTFRDDVSKSLIEFGKPILGPENPRFQQFVVPGMLTNAFFAFPYSMAVCYFVLERSEGMMGRAAIAGVTAGEFLFAQMTTQFLYLIAQATPMIPLIYYYLELPMFDNFPWVIAFTFLSGMSGVSIGLFMSFFLPTLQVAALVMFSICYPSWFISGCLWPLEGVSNYYLRLGCWASHLTWSTETIRSMMVRGWGIQHYAVWSGFAVVSFWGVLSFLGTWVMLHVNKSKLI